MTAEEVTDYIANECGSEPYFDHYEDECTIVLTDNEGNRFTVRIEKEM